ncbi:hypothetical protein TIFTF001_024195 [Ficus carica]|uniref:Uncharacterized protein n=1 Tax=Ficus carica TaxID=3494 RepID=A0AA88DKB7_FICCA|nr:hypothetical protein TIFTF001_024195 [Ficus carica]
MQQSNPRLVHHGQYQNQPSPLQLQQQLQLRSYDEDLSALHSDYLPWRFFFFLQCEALSAFGLSRRVLKQRCL